MSVSTRSNRPWLLLPHLQRLDAVGGCDHRVSIALQNPFHHHAQAGFILDDQDHFLAAVDQSGSRVGPGRRQRGLEFGRQEHLENVVPCPGSLITSIQP